MGCLPINSRSIIYLTFLSISLATISVEANRVHYKGYKVFRLHPTTDDQVRDLQQVQGNEYRLNFWTGPSKIAPTDVMIPPYYDHLFRKFLESRNIPWQILIEDVEERIPPKTDTKMNDFTVPEQFWYDYRTIDEIYAWLEFLAERYKPFVQLVEVGKSYENRTILGVHISFGKKKPIIFIDGGLHSNEWIGPAAATYTINQILTNSDPKMRSIIESHDWIILPCVNPDGYVYAHNVDRLWRKNRRPTGICEGVDLNRNFPYQWMGGGGGIDTCFPHYAGPNALSEPETQSFSNYFKTIASKVDLYLSYHSYIQVFLIPYAHGAQEVPKNNDKLHRIGNIASRAAYGAHEARYLVGNSAEVLYVGSGTSTDWVQKTFKSRITVYTMELRDTGDYGYLLPQKQIIPCGEETFAAVISMVEQINK